MFVPQFPTIFQRYSDRIGHRDRAFFPVVRQSIPISNDLTDRPLGNEYFDFSITTLTVLVEISPKIANATFKHNTKLKSLSDKKLPAFVIAYKMQEIFLVARGKANILDN